MVFQRRVAVIARTCFVVTLCLLSGACLRREEEKVALANRLRGDAYALDKIARTVPSGSKASCPDAVSTIEYRGDVIPYASPVRVAPEFAVKLRLFEKLVAEVATEHYGRAPTRMQHLGARVCRSIRGRPDRLSEHALGNALDVSGFQFDRVRTPSETSFVIGKAFNVSVQKHWQLNGSQHHGRAHERFLHELFDRVLAQHVFRGVVGPGHEGHADHFHFDQAPWRYSLL